MSSIGKIWQTVYAKISGEERDPRKPIRVKDANGSRPQRPVDSGQTKPVDRFQPQEDYVLIRVNELFLSESRQWFTEIEPIVFASTEFLYGGQERTDPFLVGPKKDETLPRGMVLKNTTVSGPHPYRGGPLTLTIVLSRLPVGNVARPLIEVIEATGKALDPAIGLSTYLKVGNVMLDGFEKLLGLDGVKPLIGFRNTVNPDAGDTFDPGYFALIDMPAPDPTQFWAKNDELVHGATFESAKPFRAADFVLFQIARAPSGRRGDLDKLPFYPLWRKALEAASSPAAGAWDEAKANLAVVATAINLSPDLTWLQGRSLLAEYIAQLKAVHEETLKLSKLAAPPDDGLQAMRREVSDILALR
jgi:hypothetical protein